LQEAPRIDEAENKEILVKILTYHVVPGKVTSTDLKSGDIKSVEGSLVPVVATLVIVGKDNANVTKPDIEASNGVIHQIDKVLLPPSLQESGSSQPNHNQMNRSHQPLDGNYKEES